MSSGDEIEYALDYILVPPSRNTFALSCRVSASSWHISALLADTLKDLTWSPHPAQKRPRSSRQLISTRRPQTLQNRSPGSPKSSRGPPKSRMGAAKSRPGRSKTQLGKASCSPERSCGRPSSFLLPILNHLGSNLDAQEVPKAGPELHSIGFRNVFARFLGVFPRSKAKSDNS